ncbi:unnamed protein product [Larinioides sclopetarius]|uniref:Uncharacterized protein n=1 Tax=Larinioides sclopetarius TaxID=280406 RepID=A0AAV1ZZ41_9ARAC
MRTKRGIWRLGKVPSANIKNGKYQKLLPALLSKGWPKSLPFFGEGTLSPVASSVTDSIPSGCRQGVTILRVLALELTRRSFGVVECLCSTTSGHRLAENHRLLGRIFLDYVTRIFAGDKLPFADSEWVLIRVVVALRFDSCQFLGGLQDLTL